MAVKKWSGYRVGALRDEAVSDRIAMPHELIKNEMIEILDTKGKEVRDGGPPAAYTNLGGTGARRKA